jgi:hypothetical protein
MFQQEDVKRDETMSNVKAQSSNRIQSSNVKIPRYPPLLKGGEGGLMSGNSKNTGKGAGN